MTELHATQAAPASHEREAVTERAPTFRRDPLRRRVLAVADTLAVGAACLVAGVIDGAETALWALVSLPAWLVLAKLHGLYDRDHRTLRHLTVDEVPSLFGWTITGSAVTALVVYASPGPPLGYGTALVAGATAGGAGFLLRTVARAAWRKLTPPDRAVIVGSGPLANLVRRKLRLFRDMHIVVADMRSDIAVDDVSEAAPWLDGIDRILVAANPIDDELVAALVRAARERRIKLSLIPPTGAFGTAVHLNRIAELPVVEYNTWDISRSTMLVKRTLDVTVAAVALVLLSPVVAAVAVAIVLDSRGSPIFVQQRAGRGGKPFRMLKFRTMVADAEDRLAEIVAVDELEEPMFKLPHDPRVTRVGRFLRRASLDELPQLFNVLRGDMSLVGPRPEQVELVDRYRPEHRFRLAVKPGLTGPMQVYGRGELTFEERLAVERDYIENLSIGRDLRILGLTVAAVAGGRGAY